MTRSAGDSDIAQYFDARVDCCANQRRIGRSGRDRATRMLREALMEEGLAGRSLLEGGCGEGGLLLDLVGAGAARGTGLDLSSASVNAAKRRAARAGLGDRTAFAVGNAATTPLQPHDVVVLDKVICCYGDVDRMLGNTLPAARQIYAISMPRTDGIWSVLSRVGVALENLGRRIRRNDFRAYAHDARAVHRAIEAAGFRLRRRRDRLVWFAAVYARDV